MREKLLILQEDMEDRLDGGYECRAHDSVLSDFIRQVENIIILHDKEKLINHPTIEEGHVWFDVPLVEWESEEEVKHG